jgi:hypothetical protein
MAGERTFVVKFISDTLGFNKGIKKVSDDVNGIGGKLKTLVPSFRTLAVAGTAAFGAIAASSIKLVDMASNLEESQSKVNTVFGASAKVVNDFAKQSAVSFGITKQSALEAAGTFGNLIQAFGIGKGQAAEMSTTLLGLAADLASFNNTNIEEAIQALRSGLSGEAEPLKRFGVAINDVRLKQEAMNLGLYDGKGALDITAKTQASYALILKDTALAQGDFERTSGGFANQMRILKASLSDAATEIGLVLLPYFKNFVSTMNQTVVPAIKIFAENVKEKGISGALAMATAQMGEFGITAINVIESAYLSLVSFTHEIAKTVRIIADGAALAYGLKGNLIGAAKSLAVAVAMKEIQFATEDALANAGAMFDGFRRQVYLASVELANFGKPPKDISDSLDRMSQSTRSASLAATALIPKAINLGDGVKKSGNAIKTAAEKIKEYSNALKSAASEEKSFSDAQKSSNKARKSQAEADLAVVKAQQKLNQISQGFGADSPQAKAAQVELARAQRDQERATFAVEEAIYSVADAEMNLAKVRKDPESSPMDIRRAELNLAESKLSVADAMDSQIDATKDLNEQQTILNETIFGATIGSLVYDDALRDVIDAKEQQMAAAEALADAIDREREAQDKLNESLKVTADLLAKSPKLLAGVANPMAGISSQPANTVGALGFSTRSGDTYAININSAIADAGLPDLVVKALQTYNKTVGKIPVTTK